MKKYDSKKDTQKHIKRVNEIMKIFTKKLLKRAENHDKSKLQNPEKKHFDEYTPKLASSTYGSKEYAGLLKGLKPALDHHYKNNSHHPEHYKNGINDFDLFDLVELFVDWKSASERHDNGDIYKSIEINKKRFKMSDQLASIFKNTAERMGYKK
jgi:hypothetical protein